MMGVRASVPAATLTFGVLGPVNARRGEEEIDLGGPKQRAVLAMLLSRRGQVLTRDRVIDGVWGDEASDENRSSFHTYVSNLRRVLGDVITRVGDTYRIEMERSRVDADVFGTALDEARHLAVTDPGSAATSLREALALWRGRPYADLADVPGLGSEIRRLEELRLEAVELRLDAELALGFHGALIAELEALAEEHPTRERFRAQHMLALYRSGRQSEALRAFRRTESFLNEELGVEPSQELRDLELKILQQDDSLLGGAGRSVTQRLAVLFTRVDDASLLWDRDPQLMANALGVHDRVMNQAIEAQRGRVIKNTGEHIVAVLPDGSAAAATAESAQRGLVAADWGEVDALRVAMGIDVGEVEEHPDGLSGPPLKRAARLCAIAHGGQVLVSSGAQSEVLAVAPPGLQIRNLGEFRLPGLANPERVTQLVLAGLPSDFPDPRLDTPADLADRVEVMSLPGYEARERIGEGAFGVVWKAYQPSVGREVAIKVIRPELVSDPSFIRRFEAEARTIARLAHPHIVPLIDFWRDADSAYLVLGMMSGGSLAETMAHGKVDRATARQILAQVGAALDYAHSQAIVHGDLKPSNIILDGTGNAYLSDFAAGLFDPDTPSSNSTEARYRAPEVGRSGPTPQADLFAFGTLVSELLEGELAGNAVLARATAPNPADRYPSASALVAALTEAQGEEPKLEQLGVTRNPYKGLRAFDQGDAADFYGRDDLVATLLAALSQNRFVTVVGPSGSGKSSAVHAGLLPALTVGGIDGSARWSYALLTPGPEPIESLVEAINLVSPERVESERLIETGLGRVIDGELLLVVDQFEEVYTLVDDPDLRRRFIDLLAAAVEDEDSGFRVVVTLRADFYDRPLLEERLGRLVRDGLVTVLPPSHDELTEMITSPAQAVGLLWEPKLPSHITQDMTRQPGALPLLQYALTEMVERRRGDMLTTDDYNRVGGVGGALAKRAETLYRELTPAQQDAARTVLLRLVTVDEESQDTRRRVRRSELESLGIPRPDLDAVLDTFVSHRLLITDRDPVTRGPTVEVAHETLLRQWPRLTRWIEDQRDSLLLGRRLRSAMTDWRQSNYDDDFLLTGHRLSPFVSWADTTTLTAEEEEYYQASRSKDEAVQTARRRRRRTMSGILAAAAVVATTLGMVAVFQADRATTQAEAALDAEMRAEAQAERAEREAERARTDADRARSRELTASALNALDNDPGLAKLLAVAAGSLSEPTADTLSVLHTVLAADRIIERYSWPETQEVFKLWTSLHPDGDRLAAAGRDRTPGDYLEVVRLSDGEVLWSYEAEGEGVLINRPVFTTDGSRVVAGLVWDPGEVQTDREPGTERLGILIWDSETGEPVDRFDLGRCGGWLRGVTETHLLVVTMNEEAPRCATSVREGEGDQELALELVDLATGRRQVLTPQYIFAGLGDNTGGVFSGDGRYVAYTEASGADLVTVVVDVVSGDRVLEFDPSTHEGVDLGIPFSLNHDGSLLIAGDRPMAVWDVVTGEIVATFDGHAGVAWSVTFASDSDTVHSIGQSGTLHIWDARTGRELSTLPAVGAGHLSLTGDLVLVTDIHTRSAALVDLAERGELLTIPTCGGFVLATLRVGGAHTAHAEICPDGVSYTVITDLGEGMITREIPGPTGDGLDLSPDGRRLVHQETNDPTGGFSLDWVGPIRIRDLVTGALMVELEGGCTYDEASPTEYWLQEGCALYPGLPIPIWTQGLVWSPNSRWVAAAANFGPEGLGGVMVWDSETGDFEYSNGQCLGTPFEHLVFTPDSTELVFYCAGRIVVVDTTTWSELGSYDLGDPSTRFDALRFIGYTNDGSSVVAMGRGVETGWSMLWLDPESFQIQTLIANAFGGTPKSQALSPNGSLAAIGTPEGFVKVWDLDQQMLVHEISLGSTQVQGVDFVDDRRVVVAPQEGNLYIYTIDPDELMSLVRGSLIRGFTGAECARFGFGDDCPTLDGLRTGSQ